MSNEIQGSLSLTVRKNGATLKIDKSFNADMLGNTILSNAQVIGTAAEALTIPGDMTSIAQLMIVNLDADNYVDFGLEATVITQNFARLLAGKAMLLPPATTTIYAKAHTAQVSVLVGAAM